MNWKKLLPIPIVILILFYVFVFTEERQEESTSVNFWKYDFDEIKYFPPKEDFPYKDEYIPVEFQAYRDLKFFSSEPRFWIKNKDEQTNEEVIYEGSYLIKNLFTDLANLNTNFLTKETPETLQKLEISKENSPRLLLSSKGEEKTLYFGKTHKDKIYTYVLTDGFVVGLSSSIADKLKGKLYTLRDRSVLNLSGVYFRKVDVESDYLPIKLENEAYKENEILKQNWYLISGKKKRLTPNSGSKIDGLLKGFYFELFPDEPKGKGLAVLNELIKDQKPIQEIFIEFSNKTKVKLLLFTKTRLEDKDYIPLQKEVDGQVLTPAYIKLEVVNDWIQILKQIQEEPEWKPPTKQK